MTDATSLERTIELRADVNLWIGRNFPEQRRLISHSNPLAIGQGEYQIDLHLKNDGKIFGIGRLRVASGCITLVDGSREDVKARLFNIMESWFSESHPLNPLVMKNLKFHPDDGISAVGEMADQSIDLLLTDPPYSISKPYVCENQIPRRLRKDGSDFIMPKGNFGDWDNNFPPPDVWTRTVLPKVRGWAVIFCAHAQIGDYCRILEEQKFVAVGPMVWHKTNPVPFNHRHKPINAWEAVVAGKRPGTKFHGHAVHNVFKCKSPSPQQRIHSTQKPEPLLSEFVKLFSQEKELVVDPFAGSGSTLLAAVAHGREALGYENDPTMFSKASERIIGKIGALL